MTEVTSEELDGLLQWRDSLRAPARELDNLLREHRVGSPVATDATIRASARDLVGLVLGELPTSTAEPAPTVDREADDAGRPETGPAGDSGQVGGDRDGGRGDDLPRGDEPGATPVVRGIEIMDTVVRISEYGMLNAEQGVVVRHDSRPDRMESYVQWRGGSPDGWISDRALWRIS